MPSKPTAPAERIRPPAVAAITGLSLRHVQQLSAAGKIPSAAKIGGIWTYREEAVRAWVLSLERDQAGKAERHPLPVRPATAWRYGVGSMPTQESIAEAFERLIRPGRRRRS